MPKLLDDSMGPIGSVIQSMLTESEFQSLYGTGWVLADGRSVTGSRYAAIKSTTTVPDMRGVFLRGKNNGRADGNQNPDGELAIGSYQADEIKGHAHSVNYLTGAALNGGTFNFNATNVNTSTGSASTSSAGGNESRPKNVTVNNFIRIN